MTQFSVLRNVLVHLFLFSNQLTLIDTNENQTGVELFLDSFLFLNLVTDV